MSAKKSCALFISAAVLSVIAVCLIFGVLCVHERCITADEFSVEIEAIQFGDIPEAVSYRVDKKYPEITLSTESAALYGTMSAYSHIYEKLLSGLLAEESQISFSGMSVTVQEIKSAFTQVLNTNPELFYVSSLYNCGSYDGVIVEYVKPTYNLSGKALSDARTQYEELVLEIISQVSPSWSELEKVLFVHDYIVKNFEYDHTYSVYDTYDFLKNKKGVCQAYTLLCIELLERLDIGVGAVPSDPMEHIWNSVEIDGKWYHMDITWDDPCTTGNIDRFDEVSYENFLCSDAKITESGHCDWVSNVTFSDDYDSLFFKTVTSKIDLSPLNEDWYILIRSGKNDESGISLARADFESNTYIPIIHIKTKWYVWGSTSSYYQDIFAGFGRYFDSLVISTAKELYAYNPDAGLVKLGDYLYEDGYICGMLIVGSTATFRVTKDPNAYAENTHIVTDLSEITFDLNIVCQNKYEVGIGTHKIGIGWGKDFSIDAPSFESYTPDAMTISGRMPLCGMSETVVYKQFASLKINYIYRNGDTAHESYIDEKFEVGQTYSIVSPSIDEYFSSIATVEGKMTEEGVEITVVYSKDFYSLKINYVYSDGSPATPEYLASDLLYMSEYSVPSPEIIGFTPSILCVSGKIDDDLEITVTYTVTQCSILVKYLYPDGSLIEEKSETLNWGADFEFVSPTLTGYTAENATISGKAERSSVEFIVRYTANKYLLQIQYIYADGTPIGEIYTEEIEYGAHYSVLSPIFDNYTATHETVSGIMTENGVSVIVTYSLTKYKVSFISEGDVFFETELEYGSLITLPDTLPQKAPTAQIVYIFNSWDGYIEDMIVEDDISFTAVFDEDIRKYKVMFQNHDGTVLYETEVEYGGTAVYVGDTPMHLPMEGMIYTFVEWDEDTENITSDSVFTAVFSDGVTKYTVSFYDEDGTLLKREEVYHGHSATPPASPIKASDTVYSYKFSEWDGKYKRVTSDRDIYAKYTAEYIEYMVIFKNYDGMVISEQKLYCGDKITIPEAPVRESDGKYEYVFLGWSPDVENQVHGNSEYQAVFSQRRIFKYSAQNFINAFEEIASAVTLTERFNAISRVVSMKEDTDLSDPALAETLNSLEREIQKYNTDVSSINSNFAQACEATASFNSINTVYINAIWFIWELVKKLLEIA